MQSDMRAARISDCIGLPLWDTPFRSPYSNAGNFPSLAVQVPWALLDRAVNFVRGCRMRSMGALRMRLECSSNALRMRLECS